jgi:ribonuclease BN (tRNA processing enzyme)
MPDRFDAFLSGHEDPKFEHRIFETFDFRTVGGGDQATIGELTVRFADADHPPPTIVCRFEADGKAIAYSSDTGPGGGLVDLAEGVDLLVCEAGFQGDPDDKPWPHHLTAGEAGEIAKRASVRRLMLTHLWPTLDPKRSILEAEATFGREVELAVPGKTIAV